MIICHFLITSVVCVIAQKQSFLGELQDEDTAERKMLKQEIETLQSRLSQQVNCRHHVLCPYKHF